MPVVAPAEFAGQECVRPPVMHCPDADCASEVVTDPGPALEPGIDRNFFIDYPCDLRQGEKVTFVLSLHGGGSYGNWQRHYFPIFDYVDDYRLIVASPHSPVRAWRGEDDEYLHNIVDMVYAEFGDHIDSFWLAGHSQGGATSRRLVCSDYFRDRVDGFLSLSGGRVGTPRPTGIGAGGPGGGVPGGPPRASSDDDDGDAPAPPRRGGGFAATPLDCDFSFVYTSGEHELRTGLPGDSEWADRYNCGARAREEDVVDTVAGYVWDPTRQDPGSDLWGHEPGPGTAEVYVYQNCDGDRVVADVVRIDKGHTEGLEPNVTERLVQLIVSAPSDKNSAG
jgi:hypothetical protein